MTVTTNRIERTIRLACWHCDGDDGDFIKKSEAKARGWREIITAGVCPGSQMSTWWTHLGICPECVKEGRR